MHKFFFSLLIVFIIQVPASAQWRGGEGRNRVGTGLRDASGSNSGQWYLTGAVNWTQIEKMAKQRAQANGHPGRFESYLWRFMPEPPPLGRPVPPPIIVPPPVVNTVPMDRPRIETSPEMPSLGVEVAEFDDGECKGLLVTKVLEDSPATRLTQDGGKGKGVLEPNIHVILDLNGVPVTTLAQWKSELSAAGNNLNLRVFDKNTGKESRYKAILNASSGAPR